MKIQEIGKNIEQLAENPASPGCPTKIPSVHPHGFYFSGFSFFNSPMSPARWLSSFMPSLCAIGHFLSPTEPKKYIGKLFLDLWHHFWFGYISLNSPISPATCLSIIMPSLKAIRHFSNLGEPKKYTRDLFLDTWRHFQFSYTTLNSLISLAKWPSIVMPSLKSIGQILQPSRAQKVCQSYF